MRDAIRRGTGALIVGGTPTALLAQRVTTNVPVVAILGDPVSAGLTRDVRRPEGNITGFGNSRPETASKIVDLARFGLARVQTAGDRGRRRLSGDGGDVEAAGECGDRGEEAVDNAVGEGLGASMRSFASLGPGDVAYVEHALADHAELAAIALRHRIPTIGKDRDYVKLGGLLAYNTRTANVSIRQVTMLDKLLKGVPVAQIPWELPDDIYLGVNLKTAQALGLTIPADIRLRATQVIE
jgi:putative ABC transport system substrate-binding protein